MKFNILNIFGKSMLAGSLLLIVQWTKTSDQPEPSSWSHSPALRNPILAQMGMGGGMGGMGGGMGGMGIGMGGMGMGGDPVHWERPQGDMPTWLISGKNSVESLEVLRSLLNQSTEVNFIDVPLSEVMLALSKSEKVVIEVNKSSLEDLGLSQDEPVSIRGAGTLRESLRRILEPRGLCFLVHERSIEIVSKEEGESRPAMRCYDLSFVLPDSGRTQELIQSIESSISPEIWMNGGGTSSISSVGSLLIVSTTEAAHQQIEALFYRLSQINSRNLVTPPRTETKNTAPAAAKSEAKPAK